MQDITKSCADSLRTLVGNNHGVKLGSSHSHEIVASCFGYQSKASLLADTRNPLSNLKKAEVVVFPPIEVLDRRIKGLLGDLPALPDAESLAKNILSVLIAEKWISGPVFSSFKEFATHTAKEHLKERWKMFGIDSASINLDTDVDVDFKEGSIWLTALMSYPPSERNLERLRESKITIKMPRIAANLGYGKAESFEKRFSGGTRKMSFPDVDVWPAFSR